MDSGDNSMAVFKAISELMKDADFVSANMQFYERHCDTFDENVEENKHEYKQIFEEFLKVQEDVIEGKLKEKFTDEQILSCYENLGDNLKAYELQDKETVDFLYEMIDFDKFKARMCHSKAMSLKDKQTEYEKQVFSGQLKSKSDLNLELEHGLFKQLISESVTSEDLGWKKRLETKEWQDDFKIAVYSKKQQQTKYDMFRIHAKSRKVKAQQMIDFMKNMPIEKFPFLLEEKYVDEVKSDDEKYYDCVRYRVTTAPMVTDRDQVCAVIMKQFDNGHTFICTRSMEDDRFPEQKNRIRMFVNELFDIYEIEEDGQTVSVMEGTSTFNAGGYIPASLMNMASANNYYKFFQTTYQILNKE